MKMDKYLKRVDCDTIKSAGGSNFLPLQ